MQNKLNESIVYAIKNQLLLSVEYEGGNRIIEPYCLGVAYTNNTLLRAYQTNGYTSSGTYDWKLFDLKKIKYCEVLNSNFIKRSSYRLNDKGMRVIHSQL